MRIGRLAVASLVLFVIALAWNSALHLLILRDVNAVVAPLRRANPSGFVPLSLFMTWGMTALFAFGYAWAARRGRLAEGLGYGMFFALLAGLLVDLNQYVLYPIPGRVALSWFLGGMLEFSLYGALMTRLYPVGTNNTVT